MSDTILRTDLSRLAEERNTYLPMEAELDRLLCTVDAGYHRRQALIHQLKKIRAHLKELEIMIGLLTIHPDGDLTYCPPTPEQKKVIIKGTRYGISDQLSLRLSLTSEETTAVMIEDITQEGLKVGYFYRQSRFLTHKELASILHQISIGPGYLLDHDLEYVIFPRDRNQHRCGDTFWLQSDVDSSIQATITAITKEGVSFRTSVYEASQFRTHEEMYNLTSW